MKNLIYYSILFSILLSNNIKAQEADTRKSFLLTGVSVNIPKGNTLSVYGGVSASEEHTQMSMVMPNIKLNKLFTFTPLYVFLKSPVHGRDIKNHQINAMLTFSLPIDKKINGFYKIVTPIYSNPQKAVMIPPFIGDV